MYILILVYVSHYYVSSTTSINYKIKILQMSINCAINLHLFQITDFPNCLEIIGSAFFSCIILRNFPLLFF